MTSFIFKHNAKFDHLDIILHGSGAGIESEFIQKIVDASSQIGHSALAFNFPYIDLGTERIVGSTEAEVLALEEVLQSIEKYNFQTIRLIGKSLGGMVASQYAVDKKLDPSRFSIVILGYIVGSMATNMFPGKIKIIHGQKDKFGDINVVKEDMAGAISDDITFIEIPNADHSYRNPDNMQPEYQDSAIEQAIH